MVSRKLAGIVAGGIIAALAGTTAQADIIYSTFESVSPGQNISYSVDGGSNFADSKAGTFNWTRSSGDYHNGGAAGHYITYCIELSQRVAYGDRYTYEAMAVEDAAKPGAGMGQAKADLLSELFGRFHRHDFDQQEATGFQAAVWEIVHDSGSDLATGDFQVVDDDSDFYDIANTWLGALDGTGPMADLAAMTSDTVQDQIFIVPAPTSMSLAVLGVFAATRRRRKTSI